MLVALRCCTTCKELKPPDQFHVCTKVSHGRQSACILCRRKEAAEYRQKNRDRIAAKKRDRFALPSEKKKAKEYSSRPEVKEKTNVKSRLRRKENKEKRTAHVRVTNALRSGLLEREPCEICGTRRKVQAHHDDYTKPLIVRWLCVYHHNEWHRCNKPLTYEDYATKEPPPHGGVIPSKEEPK